MATAEPTTSTDIADIQRQMAQIRSDMHQEVQGAVRTAQSLTDWHAMVKNHPWLSLSAATVVGYLLVPRRHAETPTIVTMHAPRVSTMPANFSSTPELRKSPWRFIGTALSLLAPIAVRAAQNYALRHVEDWLAQHPLPGASGHPVAGPTREPGQATSHGTVNRLREQR